MCPSLIQIGSKTAEKNSAQTKRQTDRHYENNGHLTGNQQITPYIQRLASLFPISIAVVTLYSAYLCVSVCVC